MSKNEVAELAAQDARVISEMAAWLDALSFEIQACGSDGSIELAKVRNYAPAVIKAAAKYLPNFGDSNDQ